MRLSELELKQVKDNKPQKKQGQVVEKILQNIMEI